ncbi:hypothetical protein [[Eubacterium] cellulosolvens]
MTESTDDLAKSIEDLRAEVRELREMVNMLVDIIVNMESDDGPEFENDYFDLHKLERDSRFSM